MNIVSVSRKTVSILILATWMFAAVALNRMMMREKVAFASPVDEPPFVWQPELYRILTFGNVPAAVDGLLLRFLVEDNIKHVGKGVTARVYYILDLATDLDPAFFTLYTAGTGFLSIVRNDKESALKLITKGENFRKYELSKYPAVVRENFWRDEWRIPFLKGYVQLFELGNLEKAGDAYRELETIPGVPSIVRSFGNRFNTRGGIYYVGMNVLNYMISIETDENALRELKLKQKSLSLSSDLAKLNEEFKHYEGGWAKFKREKNIPDLDAFGGKVYVNSEGQIDTTTERMTVLGIK